MSKVILSVESSVIREVNLDKERVTIGRKPGNDIQIENLAVSSEHARIITILNDSFLEDLNSTNGTLVNGNPIKKHILQNNDIIEIGKYTLTYVADTAGAGQTSAEDFERTMVLRMPSAARRPEPAARTNTVTRMAAAGASAERGDAAVALAPAPAPAPAVQGAQAHIRIMTGPGVGIERMLTKNLITVGKPGVQVAVITKRPQGYFITHVEGKNFPVLNGIKQDAAAHLLKDHDVIEVAGVKMEFFLR